MTGAGVLLAAAAGAHVLLVLGEITVTHPTAHAHLAAAAMTRGRYARWFWPGLAAVAVAVSAPWIGAVAVPFALVGPAGPRARLRPGRPVGPARLSPCCPRRSRCPGAATAITTWPR